MCKIYHNLHSEPYNALCDVITYSVHGFEDYTIVLILNQKQLLVKTYCTNPHKYLHVNLIKIIVKKFAKSFPNGNIKLISYQIQLSFRDWWQFILVNCSTVEFILGEWPAMATYYEVNFYYFYRCWNYEFYVRPRCC